MEIELHFLLNIWSVLKDYTNSEMWLKVTVVALFIYLCSSEINVDLKQSIVILSGGLFSHTKMSSS